MKQEINNQGKIIRIMSKDIEDSTKIYLALTRIKGISWAISNAICKNLKIDKSKRIGELTKEELEKITNFREHLQVKKYLFNRKKDFNTGEDKHLIGVELELEKEFDLKRLKKIKSYRGYRHVLGLPVRGQKTRSNFRKNRKKGVGIKKKTKNQK